MTVYKAPLADINFALDMCELPKLMSLPKFADIDPSVVGDLIAEAARFFEETFAPLNKTGDIEGSRRNDDGSVTTPTGFKDAYRA